MDRDFRIIPSNAWKDEVSRYLSRLDKLITLDPTYKGAQADLWPYKIWPSKEIDNEKFVAFRTAVFCNSIFSHAFTATLMIVDLWKTGRFFAVPLNTRFVYESWGAVRYARNVMKEPDIQKALQLTNQLLAGVYKAEVFLPWGPQATEKSPNVLEYIRSLKSVDAEAEDVYAFLSSASHPNTLQNSYFSMMGPPAPNWSNAKFKEHGHHLLEMVLRAHEQAVQNMQSETAEVLKEAADILRFRRG